MTERELDVLIAEKIFKTKVNFLNQKHGWRVDYVAEDKEANEPIIAMGMIDTYRLKYFSKNIKHAIDLIQKLHPDDETFRLTIETEVNEGFSGYHVTLNGIHAQNEKSMAFAIALAALNYQEMRDNPPVKEEDLYEGKSIYMKKDGDPDFIGIHGTYMKDGTDLHLMESWLNVYNPDKTFKYSAARLFGPIEDVAEEYKKDGWLEVPDFEDKK